MMPCKNEHGQTIGDAVPNWKVPSQPEKITLIGNHGRLEPLVVAKHADDLYAAFKPCVHNGDWTFLRIEPFQSVEQWQKFIEERVKLKHIVNFAVIDNLSSKAVGMIALDPIDSPNGVIEVGSVFFSPLMKNSILSTEVQYLLMAYVFDKLSFRRYQWKCNSLNISSWKAAERLGFTYEGTFRNFEITKGRNRDTAWFSVINNEWPKLKTAFQAWLDSSNFYECGRQVKKLTDFRKD
ncbi:uncharacterized protein YIR042C-like [Contarinia nasturtii]|uniref:uncharacterized protein YIR042C-like n=1 Tax=Contarinia nasturtii TaxID=265458 RepID=UPI0012D39E17|nr:uncharacterized protein YIR042C-like [Contarinia nasturtii]